MELSHGYDAPRFPPDPLLKFDRHQFTRRPNAVSTGSRISYQDFDKMHTNYRSSARWQRWVPEFANNNEQLRKVLALSVWRSHYGSRVPMPEGLENDRLRLGQLGGPAHAKRKWSKMVHREAAGIRARLKAANHIHNIERAGGMLHMLAIITHLSWRLGYHCTDVADQLNMSPVNVRIIKWRLVETARQLGFTTYVPHKSGETKKKNREAKRARCRVYEAAYRAKKRAGK